MEKLNVNVRIAPRVKGQIKDFCNKYNSEHALEMNQSDFIRIAIDEKIDRLKRDKKSSGLDNVDIG